MGGRGTSKSVHVSAPAEAMLDCGFIHPPAHTHISSGTVMCGDRRDLNNKESINLTILP